VRRRRRRKRRRRKEKENVAFIRLGDEILLR